MLNRQYPGRFLSFTDTTIKEVIITLGRVNTTTRPISANCARQNNNNNNNTNNFLNHDTGNDQGEGGSEGFGEGGVDG